MLRGQPVHNARAAGSAPNRSLERRRNQAPPVARGATPRQRSKRPRQIRPTPLVAQPDLGHEPIVGCHLIDVKAAPARRGADNPLARAPGFDDDTLVIEEMLRGSEHA